MTFMQPAVGKLLHCAWTVDPTMLHAVNDISPSASKKGTEETFKATVHLRNCASTHPDAEIICRASDVIPQVDGDAAQLVAPEAT